MADKTEPQTYNIIVGGMVDRLNTYIEEMQKSQSANLVDFNVHDKTRLKSYLTALVEYIDWAVGQPMLDLPETSPQLVSMNPFPVIQEHENPMITDVVRLLCRLRDEMVNSQTSRQSTGFVKHDEVRARSIIKFTNDFMDNYVEKVSPVDLPETVPSAPVTGPGKTGV